MPLLLEIRGSIATFIKISIVAISSGSENEANRSEIGRPCGLHGKNVRWETG
jgi:hypothetical protein